MAGQMIAVVRIVLYAAIFIIFTVAIVIINNSLVMATMERVREIGTLRAIGARRGLVFWMLLTESTVLTGVFGLVGAAVGAAIVLALGSAGLPAGNEMMQFFFAGKHLYPFLQASHVVLALVIMFVVSAISTAYPAWVATRITPLEAMQKED
jgi:ABC-type antimicrobial peptide transport system permease subunit